VVKEAVNMLDIKRFRFLLFLIPVLIFLVTSNESNAAKTSDDTRNQILETYGKLPLSFEVNQGQTDRSVKYLMRGSRYTLFFKT